MPFMKVKTQKQMQQKKVQEPNILGISKAFYSKPPITTTQKQILHNIIAKSKYTLPPSQNYAIGLWKRLF